MLNAITSALSGLNTATKQVENAAQNIASGSSQENIIEDVVDIKVAETAYKANVAVLNVADELNEELLSTFDRLV